MSGTTASVFMLAGMLAAGSCSAAECTPVALGVRLENVLNWTTASEQDSFGFDIFRGNAETGPFVKLTAQPVLAAGTTDQTNVYKYADASIETGKTYWYYIELISTGGAREKITPTWSAPPKCTTG